VPLPVRPAQPCESRALKPGEAARSLPVWVADASACATGTEAMAAVAAAGQAGMRGGAGPAMRSRIWRGDVAGSGAARFRQLPGHARDGACPRACVAPPTHALSSVPPLSALPRSVFTTGCNAAWRLPALQLQTHAVCFAFGRLQRPGGHLCGSARLLGVLQRLVELAQLVSVRHMPHATLSVAQSCFGAGLRHEPFLTMVPPEGDGQHGPAAVGGLGSHTSEPSTSSLPSAHTLSPFRLA
jgi:hypothetical protein